MTRYRFQRISFPLGGGGKRKVFIGQHPTHILYMGGLRSSGEISWAWLLHMFDSGVRVWDLGKMGNWI